MIRVSATALSIVLAASVPLVAQDAPAPTPPADTGSSQLEAVGLTPPTVLSEGHNISSEEILAGALVGQSVYLGVEAEAATVGTIQDLVIGPLGDVTAAIVSISGVSGVENKDVAVAFADIVRVPGPNGELRYVLEATIESLAIAPAFVWPADMGVDASTEAVAPLSEAEEADQFVEGDPNAEVVDPNETTDRPEIITDTGSTVVPDAVEPLPEALPGMGVYGVDDQPIGTISGVLQTDTGAVDAIIVDVGGFLGLGAKPVALAYENLSFSTDVSGRTYLYLPVTRAALEAQPDYDPGTYPENRDTQRLVVAP
jgi:hypothetical protein